MSRVVASIAVGSLAGSLLGAAILSGDLVEAAALTQREAWWDQGLLRLTALTWQSPLRALALWCVGGAVVGALARGRLAVGGRVTALAGTTLLVIVPGAEIARSVLAARPDCEGPNIVWIVLDALRADHLGCYGYEHDTSPFIDDLARRGTRFEFAISQESYTLASAASYFTSTYPPVSGVMYDEPQIDTLSAGMLTVAEVLRDRGYATAAFVFNPHLQARYHFGQGFDVYDDAVREWPPGSDPHAHDLFDTAQHMHEKVERYLIERQQDDDQQPTALYLHYRDIHGPYVPPPPYHEMFAPDDWTEVQRTWALNGTCRRATDPAPVFIEDLGYRLAQYDGEIRYTDDALVRLFELLASHGIDSTNTVVVVTADHGEEFRDEHPDDQRGWTHGRTLYVEQVHVPLIITMPDSDVDHGRVVEAPVELLDVAPTLVELAGCDGAQIPGDFQGRSLLPLLRGETRSERPLYSGGNHGRGLIVADGLAYYAFDENTKTKARRPSLRPDESYVGKPGEQLFDMRADPAQTVDVLADHPQARHRFAALLAQWLQLRSERGGGSTAEVDAETVDQLRALGYLGGTEGEH